MKYSIFVKDTRHLITIENKRNLDTKWHPLRNGQNEHTIILHWPGKLLSLATHCHHHLHEANILIFRVFKTVPTGHIGSSTNRKITLYVDAFDKVSSISFYTSRSLMFSTSSFTKPPLNYTPATISLNQCGRQYTTSLRSTKLITTRVSL